MLPIYANKKTILFDVDGTIVDSFRDIHNTLNRTLSEFGLPLLTEAESIKTIGPGREGLAIRILKPEHMSYADAVTSRYYELYYEHCLDETKLYPHVIELLDALKGRNLTVVSNKPQGLTEKILRGLGIYDRFVMVVCPEIAEASKPDPTMIRIVLEKTETSRSEAVIIGDSEKDILAGNRAGIASVAVTHGYTDMKILQRAGSDIICKDLFEIEELFINQANDGGEP